MAYEIAIEPKGVYCTYRGHTGMHEVLAVVEAIAVNPDVDQFRYAIHDCRHCTEIQLQEDALTLVSAQSIGIAISNSKLKGALISSDPRILKALEQYSALTGREVLVFDTLEAARAWASSL